MVVMVTLGGGGGIEGGEVPAWFLVNPPGKTFL